MNQILKQLLDKHYRLYPEDKNIKYWAGCNYYVNNGKHSDEPVGTATSMHDCDGCERIDRCILKKDAPIWEYNEEVEKDRQRKMIEAI